jgi:hypothetical protein
LGFGIGIGPRLFRVRVSTRGVGLSSGVGPVSVWTSSRRRSHPRRSGHVSQQVYSFRPGEVSATDHTGAAAGDLVSTTGDAIVSQLTRADRWLLAWSWLCVLSLFVGIIVPWFLLLALAAVLVAWLGFLPQRVHIEYEVDDSLTLWFGDLAAGWSQLSKTKGRWRLQSSTHLHKTHQKKVNAGAGTLVSRHAARFSLRPPRALEVNMQVPTIKARGNYLIFLPDRILVKSGSRWSDVEYSHLIVKASQSRFIENKRPPQDGLKVDERWQYTNVKGGPDKRFKNNRRLPVMLYDEVSLTSDMGLSWIIQLSRHDPAKWWEMTLRARPVAPLQPHDHIPLAPQARSAPRNNAGPQAAKPPQWSPRAGWGTIRGYQFQSTGNGRANLRFYFVPDDGSQPRLFDLADMAPLDGMGEYARGVMRDGELKIKVDAETMLQAEQTLHGKINLMDLVARKAMFADGNDVYEDAGWAWTPDYKLAKAAPGLLN